MNYIKDKEIRQRLVFTFFIIGLYVMGILIPLPVVSDSGIKSGILSYFLTFLGGSDTISLFALGISPYVSASIMIQLATGFGGKLKRLSEDGAKGQNKIKHITYYLTFILALIQASVLFTSFDSFASLIRSNSMGVKVIVFLTLALGSIILAYLADLINIKGIGQGLSMIIAASICMKIPSVCSSIYTWSKDQKIIYILILLSFILTMIVATSIIISLEHRISIYSSSVYDQGDVHYIPIKFLASSILPVIVVSSLFAIISGVIGYYEIDLFGITDITRYRGIVFYGFLVYIFSYFYNLVQVDASVITDQMKKSMFYIKGYKSYSDTEKYIRKTVIKISHYSSPVLSVMVILPLLISKWFSLGFAGSIMGVSLILLTSSLKEFSTQLKGLYYSREDVDLLGGDKV